MKTVIFSGKGGAGKTTITSLITTYFTRTNKTEKILIIDADASANLHLSLGIQQKPKKSAGELEDLVGDAKNQDKIFDEFTSNCILKTELFDYVYMGHHERNSCLCSYNNTLRFILEQIKEKNIYDLILIDREAGIEHLTRNIYGDKNDKLIIVSWLSEEYAQVAKDINELADILGTTKNRLLVLNNIQNLEFNESDLNDFLKNSELDNLPYVIFPAIKVRDSLKKLNSKEILDQNQFITEALQKIYDFIIS